MSVRATLRISLGGALFRPAMAALVEALHAMRKLGSFSWMLDMLGMAELGNMLCTGTEAAEK
jgi:hypothetical protein